MASSDTGVAVPTATKNTLAALHTAAIGEIMQYMAGLYNNIEDSLFELAFTDTSPIQQRHIGELMKELRFRRATLLKTFAGRLRESTVCWWGSAAPGPELIEERFLAQQMAGKCFAHFNHLLSDISERVQDATQDRIAPKLPISPEQLSYHFLMSCRSVDFEKYSLEVINDLFARFVLDRLGTVYGRINQTLTDAGYRNLSEIDEISATA